MSAQACSRSTSFLRKQGPIATGDHWCGRYLTPRQNDTIRRMRPGVRRDRYRAIFCGEAWRTFRPTAGGPPRREADFPSQFTLWLVGLGIRHIPSRDRRPTDQGHIERNHRTLAEMSWADSHFADVAQLQAAAHKQGFSSLSEIEQCVLEPGGTLTFLGKKPGTEDVRHQQLLGRLERLAQEIALLRSSQPPAHA